MSILDKLNDLKKANIADITTRIPMTEQQIKHLSAKLKADNRVSVYPNRFDKDHPFQVTVRKNGEFTNYGTFTNIDVAAAVGTIASKANFGDRAIAGKYNQDIVEKHPEFLAWLAHEKSQETIALASV